MSTEPPPAAGPSSDERQPLLPSTSNTDIVEEGGIPPKPQPRSWKKIAGYTVLGFLGAAVLAVFIKGFLDADDVEFDLGKALKAALGGGLSGAAGTQ
ncbi:hypothetical protein DXG01_008645 [Tephrocybe rancida]|nr:hypothetical protein DXG01_008645 [Tephrocybe rancida]